MLSTQNKQTPLPTAPLRRSAFAYLRFSTLIALLLIVLLISVESSLQTTIIWEQRAWWTVWIYKAGFLSIADLILLSMTGYVILRLSVRPVIPKSPYFLLCGLAGLYLLVGFAYNVLVFTFWKTFLYDFKVFLCFLIPFLFLYTTRDTPIAAWFTPMRLFVYGGIAALIDAIVIYTTGRVEELQQLGIPVLPLFIHPIVPLVALIFFRDYRLRIFFLAVFIVVILNLVNRIELVSLFNLAVALVCLLAVYIFPRTKLRYRWLLILGAMFICHLIAVAFIYDWFGGGVLTVKSDGVNTRKIQMDNVISNFSENISGIIGKGWGSTWFENIRIPQNDIYSVGLSVGDNPAEAMASPVKFVFNWGPPSILYKWGILGVIGITWLLALYFVILDNRIRILHQGNASSYDTRKWYFLLIITMVFMQENFFYVGGLYASVLTSILAYNLEDQVFGYSSRSRQAIVPYLQGARQPGNNEY